MKKTMMVLGQFLILALAMTSFANASVTLIKAETVHYPTDSPTNVALAIESQLIEQAGRVCGSTDKVLKLVNLHFSGISSMNSEQLSLTAEITEDNLIPQQPSRLRLGFYAKATATAGVLCK